MKLFLTGGFLGSGKTTAIQQACRQLTRNHTRVAAIMNDQGDQLVDSEWMKQTGIPVREITNGCFCCNYPELEKNIATLLDHFHPEIIFAESVGSCADLVATITRPLSQFHPEISVVLSVFADASLLWSLMNGDACFLNESVRYIYKKQLEEADILVINKIDLISETGLEKLQAIIGTECPGKKLLFQNSLDEKSVQAWMNAIHHFKLTDERASLVIDYDVYGEGESMLAWLDKRIMIDSGGIPAAEVAEAFINSIYEKIKIAGLPIGHLKFFIDDGKRRQKISYTTMVQKYTMPVNLQEDAREISILINARVQTEPAMLEEIIETAEKEIAERTGSTITVNQLAAFQPGYPTPTYRM